ncbi:MAG: mannose-6-phosphate isomerase, class I [Acidimicrobiales bacterium]
MEPLLGVVRHYAWGATDIIAELQGRPATGEPEAELWLGAHPLAPGRLARSGRTLDEAVADDALHVLGPEVAARFGGRFPYLLKVLAAAEPLSIQAHPSKAQAEAGHRREEEAGVAWDSPHRTYRDDNHKPELICALTPFTAKCGFRPRPATVALFERLAAAAPGRAVGELATRLTAVGDDAAVLRSVLVWLLGRPGPDATELVTAVVAAAARRRTVGDTLDLDLAWTAELAAVHPGDIGVVVALLLNHVELTPGEAMFLCAGNLHAYLRGAGVELMANSDNVVRGGLTVKHVDIEELATVVDTTPAEAPVERPAGPCHRYHSPVPEFSLTRIDAGTTADFEPRGPEIVLVTDGSARLAASAGEELVVARGGAALIAAGDGPYRLDVGPGSLAWRAAVGELR